MNKGKRDGVMIGGKERNPVRLGAPLATAPVARGGGRPLSCAACSRAGRRSRPQGGPGSDRNLSLGGREGGQGGRGRGCWLQPGGKRAPGRWTSQENTDL